MPFYLIHIYANKPIFSLFFSMNSLIVQIGIIQANRRKIEANGIIAKNVNIEQLYHKISAMFLEQKVIQPKKSAKTSNSTSICYEDH